MKNTSLEIENFLSLKNVFLPVKRLNILIGPQAQGKSVIAKLVYFFQSTISTEFRSVWLGETSLPESRADAQNRFEEIFPRYAWSNQSFKIVYSTPIGDITISRTGKRTDSPARLDFSKEISDFVESRGKQVNEASPDIIGSRRLYNKIRAIDKILDELGENLTLFATSNFIPAGRSFFSNLERNIFSLMVNRLEVDPLIAEFGSNYEAVRSSLANFAKHNSGKSKRSKKANFTFDVGKSILNGYYSREGDDDYIKLDTRKVRLLHSSSGQQEVLPLLLTLWAGGLGGPRGNPSGRSFVIEEPEAHLFPTAQKDIIALLAKVLREDEQSSLFITTHSPYVLASVNNLLFAGGLVKDYPEISQKVQNVLKDSHWLLCDETQAHFVMDGKIEDLIDRDFGLVKAGKIDIASELISSEFDALMNLQEHINKD